MNKKIIGFAGTSAIAVPFLERLLQDFEVKFILTKKADKSKNTVAEYVKKTKFEPVFYPDKARNLDPELFKTVECMVVISYGLIIPQSVLDLTKWVNIHASLLPHWRGSCPINYSLLHGDKKTGLTAIEMVKEVDAGDMFGKLEVEIDPRDNVESLTNKMTLIGPEWFSKLLTEYLEGRITPIPQDHNKATFTKMLTEEDRMLDWNKSAEKLYNQIRSMSPNPGCLTTLRGVNIKILEAEVIEVGVGNNGEIIETACQLTNNPNIHEHNHRRDEENSNQDKSTFVVKNTSNTNGNQVKNTSNLKPGSLLSNTDDIKQLIIQCGHNALRLIKIIPESSKPMSDVAFCLGRRWKKEN